MRAIFHPALPITGKFFELSLFEPAYMLADKKLKAFIPTTMPVKAKTFYRDVLGLELLSEDEYALEFNANGVLLRVTTVPELVPHNFTVLGWNVPDISSLIVQMNN